MDKKGQHKSRSDSAQRNLSSRKNHIIRWNQKKQDYKTRGIKETEERQWTSMGR